MNEEMTKSEEQHVSLQKALQQCELVQNMIDISISSLEGLRTKCATSNDLTQKEIRTLEGKLVKYFSRQLSCKCKVALEERSVELEDFPRLGHWFRIVNLRKEVTEEMSPGEVTLEGLLEMSEEQVCELLQKFGANEEECARLNASLSCLRKAHQLDHWSCSPPVRFSNLLFCIIGFIGNGGGCCPKKQPDRQHPLVREVPAAPCLSPAGFRPLPKEVKRKLLYGPIAPEGIFGPLIQTATSHLHQVAEEVERLWRLSSLTMSGVEQASFSPKLFQRDEEDADPVAAPAPHGGDCQPF
ncbi:hypothetical protein FQN60_017991 [Etheostoma spectabile]|uniref:Kinase suppressor of Ras 2 n=1 Tax=Etheostoma spectabile TaxID=54343 RepID=A0A5J5DGP5_9PERO|nr:hypothetical protein FQN60_017991 [Etheostoma spectabile]